MAGRAALLALMVLLLAPVLAACYEGQDTAAEGPPPAGPGRVVLRDEFLHEGTRRTRRQSMEVPDPITAHSTLVVRLRNLGNAETGDLYPAVLDFGAGLGDSITLPTDAGAYTLYLRRDGTLSQSADGGALASLPIPPVGEALEFSGVLDRRILSGVYRYEITVSTDGGASSIDLSVAVQ